MADDEYDAVLAKNPDWFDGSENPVSSLAIHLQRMGFRTDVLERSLTGHGRDAYLMRYWPAASEGDGLTYVLMGDLGVTWEPASARPTGELGRISLEEGSMASAKRMAAINQRIPDGPGDPGPVPLPADGGTER